MAVKCIKIQNDHKKATHIIYTVVELTNPIRPHWFSAIHKFVIVKLFVIHSATFPHSGPWSSLEHAVNAQKIHACVFLRCNKKSEQLERTILVIKFLLPTDVLFYAYGQNDNVSRGS